MDPIEQVKDAGQCVLLMGLDVLLVTHLRTGMPLDSLTDTQLRHDIVIVVAVAAIAIGLFGRQKCAAIYVILAAAGLSILIFVGSLSSPFPLNLFLMSFAMIPLRLIRDLLGVWSFLRW